MDSVHKAMVAIELVYGPDFQTKTMRGILLQFFKDRVVEIISESDKRDLMLDDMDIKIGGTD